MATRPHGVRFTPKADIVEFEAVSSVSFFISQAPAKRRDKQGVAVSPARRTSRSFAVGVDDLFDRLARGAISIGFKRTRNFQSKRAASFAGSDSG
jgi:hypothetical protein